MMHNIPAPFGFPAWEGIKRRVAKKHINRRGRDLLRRFREFTGYKVGDLVCTCDGLNSHVTKVEPVYLEFKRGRVLLDLDIMTDRTSCSMYHCGVEAPCTYKEAIAYRDDLLLRYRDVDPYGFTQRYAPEAMTINADGTYTIKEEP